jgi:gas vesicle protein
LLVSNVNQFISIHFFTQILHTMSNNGSGNFFAGIVIGAAIGAVTALLFAPESGKRTRKRLNRKLNDLNYRFDTLMTKGKESINHISEDLEENLTEIARKGKKLMN